MEAYELDKIKVLATSFRGAIEIAKDAGEFDNDFAFPRFPKGCCGDTSDLLAEYLAQHDIYTYYVCGQKGTQSHAWLVLVNTVTVTTDNSDADRKYKSLISVYNEDNDVILTGSCRVISRKLFYEYPASGNFLFFVVCMMSLLCLPCGKLPLAFLAVPAGKDGRVECPCQTVDDFIGIRGNVCGLFLFVQTHTPLDFC